VNEKPSRQSHRRPLAGRNVIGATIREIRKKAHPPISLEDLAGRRAARGVNLDRSALGRIENGKRHVLDYEAVALARAPEVNAQIGSDAARRPLQ